MQIDPELEQRVLAHVLAPNYRPVKPRVIASQLDLDESQRAELKRVVKKLVKSGKLSYGSSHLVGPPKPRESGSGHVTGVFRRAQAGFGFVRPSGSLAGDRSGDVYVGAADAGDAATGDTVLVRLKARRGRFGAPQGQIVEIIERETHRFVGTYFESAGAAFVQVDGTVFSRPVWVGDPGARNAQPDDKVVFEMVRFPTHVHDGEGVIVERLGPSGAPGVDTLSIIREYGLPDEFSADVLEAAREQADRFQEHDLSGRLDLTDRTTITIDPIDARDFDDAISLERFDNGHWLLGVHIADVAHFVPAGTPLDREAHHRGTSVYLPDRVLPMLPEVISNALASLQPDRVRYTKTVFMEFTADGVRVGADLHSSAIRSRRRFTYEEVDQYLADPDAWTEKLAPDVHELLGRMRELARILRLRRRRQGALELNMPEVKVDLDRYGRVVGAHRELDTESHQIIEDFMLAANMAVAENLAGREWLFLRRVHQQPDLRKLKALTEFVRSLGLAVDDLESRFELQRLLVEVAERPEVQAVNYAVLRSMQRAVYSPEEEGHYALASDCYCHFTSPIRRYPDLTIHRLVDALLTGTKPRNHLGELAALGEHCSEREQRAEAAERELTRVKLLHFLAGQIGLEMDAVITGVEEFGLFAQGTELPADGLLHVSALQDDFYHYERRTHSLVGRRAGNAFRLGDTIRVAVARVDVDRRELDFRLVERRTRPAEGAPRRARVERARRSESPRRKEKPQGKSKGGKKRRR